MKKKSRNLYDMIRKAYQQDSLLDTIKSIDSHTADIIELVENATTKEKQELINNLLCTAHTGKMTGMISLSTCCLLNEGCKARAQVKGSICEKCYAQQQLKKYKNQFIKQAIARTVLCNYRFKKDEIPFINVCFFRFESFGDLENEVQIENYFNICKYNKHMHVALWTKCDRLIVDYVRTNGKPSNIQLIYSPLFIDRPEPVKMASMRGVFDKQFTVYSTIEEAEKHGTPINCGGRNCAGCLKCYKKNSIVEIAELLK